MKILAVSDVELPQLGEAKYIRSKYQDVELLVSCGDMPADYLEFIGSILNVPLFFVRGNHDTNYMPPNPGGDDLHLRFRRFGGYTFAGLEGSIRYNDGAVQYTDREMTIRVLRLMPRLLLGRARRGAGVDVFVAHSPPHGIHDIPSDYAHRGFKAFLLLMRWGRPRLLLHGHVDTWDRRMVTETVYEHTRVININPARLLTLGQDELAGA